MLCTSGVEVPGMAITTDPTLGEDASELSRACSIKKILNIFRTLNKFQTAERNVKLAEVYRKEDNNTVSRVH